MMWRPKFSRQTLETKICSFMLKNYYFKRVVLKLDKLYSSLALKAGYYGSTVKKQCLLTFMSFIFLILMAPLLVISVGVFKLFFTLPLIITLPILPQLMFLLNLKSLVSKRRNGLKKEFPYFVLYIATLQSAGVPLHMSLYKVAKTSIFENIKKEAMIFLRDVRLLGKDPLTALDSLAKNNPYKPFQDLIFGYTSIYKSGGDLVRYLHEKVRDSFKELKFQWKMFVERSMDLGESLTTFFVISVLIILLASLILSAEFLTTILLLNIVILPVALIVSFTTIESLIPENVSKLRVPKVQILLSTLVSILTFILAYYVTKEFTTAILFSSLIASFISGILYVLKAKVLKEIEEGLPKLLRDITEFRKLGFTPAQAIARLVLFRKYNKSLDTILNKIAMNIRAGLGFKDIPKTDSWLFDYTTFLLEEIEESGGGTPAMLEDLTQYVSDVMHYRTEVRKSLRIYEILAYIAPLILIFSLFLTLKLVSILSLSEIVLLLTNLGVRIEHSMLPLLKITIIETSIILSLLTSKIVDLTAKNTLRASIVLFISLVGFITIPQIVDGIISLAT